MRIAFYAPLKSPDHPVPSGDRLMGRLLVAALEMAGHQVEVESQLRSLTGSPDAPELEPVRVRADREIDRIAEHWRSAGPPGLWFTYHPYYKSPDLIGPALAERAGIPYVTAEASYSKRRDEAGWAHNQRLVANAVRQAAVNLCLTERDREGLAAAIPEGRYASLMPFIDVTPFEKALTTPASGRLVTVAMMRPGDKFNSYVMLASALSLIRDRGWTLTVIGAGPAAAEVQALFASFEPGRIDWRGELPQSAVAAELQQGGIYVWPGCGEAYGLAYLEAQAAGLPVVAQTTAGVPEVVMNRRTGLLTPDGDVPAFANAIASMLGDENLVYTLGRAARGFVHDERSLSIASRELDRILSQYCRNRS
jgi:glycosyltransferase involved in cell wall biosynthesis